MSLAERRAGPASTQTLLSDPALNPCYKAPHQLSQTRTRFSGPEPTVCLCLSKQWSSSFLCVLCCSLVSNSSRPRGLQPTRLLCPWNFSGKNPGVGCHFLLQGIFPIQGFFFSYFPQNSVSKIRLSTEAQRPRFRHQNQTWERSPGSKPGLREKRVPFLPSEEELWRPGNKTRSACASGGISGRRSVVPDCATPWTIRILHARILQWGAFPFSRGSSQPRD